MVSDLDLRFGDTICYTDYSFTVASNGTFIIINNRDMETEQTDLINLSLKTLRMPITFWNMDGKVLVREMYSIEYFSNIRLLTKHDNEIEFARGLTYKYEYNAQIDNKNVIIRTRRDIKKYKYFVPVIYEEDNILTILIYNYFDMRKDTDKYIKQRSRLRRVIRPEVNSAMDTDTESGSDTESDNEWLDEEPNRVRFDRQYE